MLSQVKVLSRCVSIVSLIDFINTQRKCVWGGNLCLLNFFLQADIYVQVLGGRQGERWQLRSNTQMTNETIICIISYWGPAGSKGLDLLLWQQGWECISGSDYDYSTGESDAGMRLQSSFLQTFSVSFIFAIWLHCLVSLSFFCCCWTGSHVFNLAPEVL